MSRYIAYYNQQSGGGGIGVKNVSAVWLVQYLKKLFHIWVSVLKLWENEPFARDWTHSTT